MLLTTCYIVIAVVVLLLFLVGSTSTKMPKAPSFPT